MRPRQEPNDPTRISISTADDQGKVLLPISIIHMDSDNLMDIRNLLRYVDSCDSKISHILKQNVPYCMLLVRTLMNLIHELMYLICSDILH